MQLALLSLCQLRIQSPWMSQDTGGEVDHCGPWSSTWLLSVSGSCYTFCVQFISGEKKNRKANPIMSEKRMNWIYYIPHKSKETRQESEWFPSDSYTTSQQEGSPTLKDRETALARFPCTKCPICTEKGEFA